MSNEEQLSFIAPPFRTITRPVKAVHLSLFIDGASRGNPGPSGIGAHVVDGTKNIIFNDGLYFGKKTNNQAEYLALVYGVWKIHHQFKDQEVKLKVVSDSLLLIKQMQGEYRVKNPQLIVLKNLADKLCSTMSCTFAHVLREYNTTADALANEGVDTKKAPPEPFKTLLTKYGFPV